MVNAKVEVITPELAEKWLESMVPNRKVSEALLLDYAIAIEQGQWALNGSTIGFNDHGKLVDGQHRLRACVLARKPFPSLVVRGISDPHAFSTIDQGKQRSAGDVFGIDGWVGSLTASAAAGLLFLYEQKRISWNGPTGWSMKKTSPLRAHLGHRARPRHAVSKEDALRFANAHRDELQAAVKFAISHKSHKILYGSVLAASHYLFCEKSRMQAERFFDDLGEGTGLDPLDPVWVLREKLIALLRKRDRASKWVAFGLTIKAWNKRRAGEKVRHLYAHEAEEFPRAE